MSTRKRIGFLSLALLAIGGVLAGFTDFGRAGGPLAVAMSDSVRWGILTAALWLAYPELARLPRWLLPAGAAIVLAAVFRIWWLLFVALGAVIVGYLMRPRDTNPKRKRGRVAQPPR